MLQVTTALRRHPTAVILFVVVVSTLLTVLSVMSIIDVTTTTLHRHELEQEKASAAQEAEQRPTTKQQTPQQQEKPSPPQFQSYWDLVAHYSSTYDASGLNAHLRQLFDSSERSLDPTSRSRKLSPGIVSRGGGFDYTSRHKLQHDVDQFEFLAKTDRITMAPAAKELLGVTLPHIYRDVLRRMNETDYNEETEHYRFRSPQDDAIRGNYNRPIFVPEFGLDVLRRTERDSLLNPNIDFDRVQRQYVGQDPDYPHPGIVVIDDLLSPEVLDRVYDLLLLSTFYYDVKTPKFGKYVGAYIYDGMHDALLMEVAYALHRAMPDVMQRHAMKEMWSYKYESSGEEDDNDADSSRIEEDGTSKEENEEKDHRYRHHRTGIHTHADDAVINVNLWITPDTANLDDTSGGLVVYKAKPPSHWVFEKYNSNWDYVEEHLLKPTGYDNVTIPYKENRAVIFDSFLFHKTDRCQFKKGYENRRINLTILYGNRADKDKTVTASSSSSSSLTSSGPAGTEEEL